MIVSSDSLEGLRLRLSKFAFDREWDQFHSPKNLACALTTEAAELLAHFRWSKADEDAAMPDTLRIAVKDEIADVLIFLVRLADKLGIDPIAAAEEKVLINEERYPISKAKGSSKKYTEL